MADLFCFGIVVSKLREMKGITKLPIGMKTNYNAEFKNVNSSKTTPTVEGSNISQINTEAKTANIHTIPRGAWANKEAPGRKLTSNCTTKIRKLNLTGKISND